MEEWFGAPPRGACEDREYLPMRHARWRARCAALWAIGLGLGAAGSVAALRSPTVADVAGPLLIVGLVAHLARVQRTRGVLLRLALSPHRVGRDAVGAVEALVAQARLHAALQARVVAVLADLELWRGERRRGLRLFYGLHARGWTASRLLGGRSEGATRPIGRAAATMAMLAAIDGRSREAERALEPLRAQGLGTPALALDAVLRLQRGDFRGAVGALAPAVATSPPRDRDAELLRWLHAYARHRMGGSPYRLEAGGADRGWPGRPPRTPWLVEQWPPLRAFAGRFDT